MSFNQDRIDDDKARIRNLPTQRLSNGQIVPAMGTSHADRMRWYSMVEQDQQEATTLARQAAPAKAEPTAAERHLDSIQRMRDEDKIKGMSFREAFMYTEEKRLKTELKQDDAHAKALSSARVQKVLASLGQARESMGESDFAMKLLGTEMAIKEDPGSVEFFVEHAKSVLGEYATDVKTRQQQAADKATQAQVDANNENYRSQAELAKANLAIVTASANLDGAL